MASLIGSPNSQLIDHQKRHYAGEMSDLNILSDSDVGGKRLSVRQRERRKRILDVTYALLAEHGYDSLSMKMIAETAGVAERTLFNIYSTKDALIATSARERTEDIIKEAWDSAPDHGIGFLLSLSETLARRTLEAPEVARALAPVLVQHADLVGLEEVYRSFVGSALETLADQGALDGGDVEVLTALFTMRMVSSVTCWASRTVEDNMLETHMRLAVCQILLPHVEPDLRDWAQSEARRCVALLSGRQMGKSSPT